MAEALRRLFVRHIHSSGGWEADRLSPEAGIFGKGRPERDDVGALPPSLEVLRRLPVAHPHLGGKVILLKFFYTDSPTLDEPAKLINQR